MVHPAFGPGEPAAEKLHVRTAGTPAVDPSELKARIARLVRADSRDRRVPTPDGALEELTSDLPRDQVAAILTQMAKEACYADLKVIVAPTHRLYLFSEAYLTPADAAEKALVEETKLAIASRIRRASQGVALTPAADLDELFPWPDAARRAEVLAEMRADERFQDIQEVTGPGGQVFYHSDAYVSGNYATVMMRAKTGDAAFSIAEFVRDRSRVMPAPTKVTVFEDRVFGVSRQLIGEFVDALAHPPPEYADIKKLVHPVTGAVYLYSDRWLHETAAYRVMDWEEVGMAQNP